MSQSRGTRVFDKQADMWNRRRYKRTMDAKWRKELLADAHGDVLELAVGAGGNFQFYPPGVRVTAVDFSSKMIGWAKLAAQENAIEGEFLVADVESATFPEESFDTVVSTLSICSYADPVGVLIKMSQWCKPDGIILLLEHGRSSNPLVGWFQDLYDPIQLKTVGCHVNRDISAMTKKAGLHVVRSERHFLGMIHMVWARPTGMK